VIDEIDVVDDDILTNVRLTTSHKPDGRRHGRPQIDGTPDSGSSDKMAFITTLFLSDILHSMDRPSISTSSNQSHRVIAWHKDDQSLYKCTRKMSRTANRLLSIVKDCDANMELRSVHLVNGGRNEGSIIKRLESEFGASVGLQFSINEKVNCTATDRILNVLQFSPLNTSEAVSFTSMRMVLFDLDSLVHSLQVNGAAERLSVVWEIAEEVISSICQQSSNDIQEHFVVHVKCNSLYQAIADMLSSTAECKLQLHVTKNDFEAHLKQLSGDEPCTDNKSSENVIRRLRQRKGASDCPLSIYPIRYIQSNNDDSLLEICRFHNYDKERGCLRSRRARENPNVKGCEMDHKHCHSCGERDHCAFECPEQNGEDIAPCSLEPMIFNETNDGVERKPIPSSRQQNTGGVNTQHLARPALVVLGGRLRGKTLASCEALPLSTSGYSKCEWVKLPNLLEHRGSHAAASPNGSGLVFVMGGGGVDGNLDTVECLKCDDTELRWQILPGRLSAPRHAFGSVTCTENNPCGDANSVSLFAVGGWKHGQFSCGSVERLSLDYPCSSLTSNQWQLCAPLLKPRRLHSVVASADERSIFVFGGFIDERHTTNSIEQYNIDMNQWSACDALPYGAEYCPLVQVIPDWSREDNSFLIFPFGSDSNSPTSFTILRYIPGADNLFASVLIPGDDEKELQLPLKNWAAFSVASSKKNAKAYLVGGTIDGRWTDRGFELDLQTMTWTELPAMQCARRRSVTLVLE
jgi:hypothetical protein